MKSAARRSTCRPSSPDIACHHWISVAAWAVVAPRAVTNRIPIETDRTKTDTRGYSKCAE
ncbi:hypothetical protein BRAO375_1190010 [Bradyrhizobium sp. ORS 375]|nr:hypothetical protein BRAO375_1190010 [Bradyrhizobium sp. ORS 375]